MRWGQGGTSGGMVGSTGLELALPDRHWDLRKKPQLCCFLLPLDNSHWGVKKESALLSTWNHVGTRRGSITLMSE